jgi:hypothetical protein
MNGPPQLAAGTEGGPKKLANVPRAAAISVGLCLLGLVFLGLVYPVILAYTDETRLRVIHIFLADLNGDTHQDAFLLTNQMHRIVFNDGTGEFTSSWMVMTPNYPLALGDLDGNGSLEALLIHSDEDAKRLECAEMPADVIVPAQPLGNSDQVFAIRDANHDGVPEDYIAGCCGAGGTIMNNRGTIFSHERTCLEVDALSAAALGDLNGDAALDIFVVTGWWRNDQGAAPNEIWFNDGLGNFTDSGQRLGEAEGYTVALGDLNADGYLDAVVGKRRGAEIWFNDGQGNFTKDRQRFGNGTINTIFMADPDGDDDLDLFLGGATSIRIWLNDGTGRFQSGQRIQYDHLEAVSVGDVTGDGSVDVFVGGPDSYQVWQGDGNGRFKAGQSFAFR